MPYQSPRHIGRLLMQDADIRANAEIQRGNNAANMAGIIGQTITGTLGDILRARDFDKQQAVERQKQEAANREIAENNAIESVLMKSVDPVTGRPDPAMAAREIQQIDPAKAIAWWDRASAEEKAQAAREKEMMTQISQTAGAILAAPPERRPTLYAQARAEMIQRGIAKPETVPELYDEGWLTKTHQSALTVAQQIESVEAAVRARETQRHNEATEKRVTFGAPEKALIHGKPGWFRTGSDGKIYGLDGAPLDPKSVTHMPEKEPKEKPAATPTITPAQRAAAERWKQGELARVEREYRASQTGKPFYNEATSEWVMPTPMSKEQLENEKKRIQQSYLEQIGAAGAPPVVAPVAPPPPGAPGASAAPKPTTPRVAPVASHQPAPKETTGAPPPVEQRTIGHVHTFSNGRKGKWDGKSWVAIS